MVGVHLAHVALVSRAHHHESADPDMLLVHPRRVSATRRTVRGFVPRRIQPSESDAAVPNGRIRNGRTISVNNLELHYPLRS